MCVNNLSKVALDSAAAGIWTRDLQSQVQRPNHCATACAPFLILSVAGNQGRGGGRVLKRMFLNTHYYSNLGFCSSLL